MSWLKRCRNVFRPEDLNTEIEAEFQYHLEETVDKLVAEGMTEEEAWRAARWRLGHYSLQKEATRDMNIAAWLDTTWADLLYGLRQLRLNRSFAVIAILSLALGIGANTAIFQLVDAIRLKTLPVDKPEELVAVDFEKGASRPGSWYGRGDAVSYAQWEQIRDRQQAFSGVAAWSPDRLNLADGGEPRMADALFVSSDFFPVLRVRPFLGRSFTAQDDTAACHAGAVLSYSFWQRAFGGSADVLDRTVRVGGHSIPVIGVTPPAFFGVQVGKRFDLALPVCADRLLADDQRGRMAMSSSWWLSIIGRLKPGWTVPRASADLRTISPGIMEATVPNAYQPALAKRFLQNKLFVKDAGTGISQLRVDYEHPLWLLMAITGLVLLIACGNLANLLLARATAREREIAVRLALGASRFRLVRQLIAESLLLAMAGSALGIAIALSLSHALVEFIATADNPLFVDLALDGRVLLFTMGLGILTCLLFGLLPAWRATFVRPSAAMQAGSRSMTASRSQFSLRRALVSIQVALSLVLLFGALLFVRSLHNLLTIDPGFNPDGLVSVNLDFSKAPYAKDRRLIVWREMYDRLSAIPRVASVAQVSMMPVSGSGWDQPVGPDAAPAETSKKEGFFNQVGPGYFRTMGTRLLAGREFSDRDTPSSPKVAIVDEAFARTFFGGANPVGHTFHMPADAGKTEQVYQIVGLVGNSKYYDVREDFKPLAFFPIAQTTNPEPSATFALRILGPRAEVLNAVKKSINAMNSRISIDFRPLSAQMQESLLRDRLMATLSAGFGFLAALLAALGIYGVISYMVAQRRNEIGVRVALGADRGRVIRLILREALLLLGIGLFAGNLLALFAGKAAAALLFGLQSRDTVSLCAASGLLAAVALMASYLPAVRAAGLHPATVLRNE
jgi:putative ABC transport system permease protein